MEIPAKLVLRKMEEELAKLKHAVNESGKTDDYRQYAQALKTYCDLILDSEDRTAEQPSGDVRQPSAADIKMMMGDMEEDRPAAKTGNKKKQTIYDKSDEPESDSLFDF
ncbi:YwdI family protein [Salipaludibacillus sp. CUR1]|uniref:YwdI family protein n=1 Tax=Salipaludibacillus sp. CUR1 TaxID=2820003 RepID=UPI001E2F85F6|nr:YwdI family protein [Salipaludibacillus sp. CUR1]MCE7791374.1 YwdI family protein [Salipaludibacillus sp. CUR1]